jgi:Fe-S cluster assembly protein SufD
MKLEAILSKGFPTTRHEAWKYTNVAEIASRPVVFSEKKCVDFIHAKNIIALQEEKLASTEDIFVNLNQYFFTEAYEIVVSETSANPTEIIYRTQALCWHQPRVKIKIEAGVKAVVIEKFSSHLSSIMNAMTIIEVCENATLVYIKQQEEDETAFHIGRTHINVFENASVKALTLSKGAKLSRSDIHLKLLEEGAEAELNGLAHSKNAMHMDHHTVIEHCAPHTKSRELYRSILADRSRGVFNGKVIVHANAHRTEAEQANHHLLLSRDAEINTKPELEIYHDDVKCKHGAAIGELEDNALFYLEARGIEKTQAKQMLVEAFGQKVLDCIEDAALREKLWQA